MNSVFAPTEEIGLAAGTVTAFRRGSGIPLLFLHDANVLVEWSPFHEALATSVELICPVHPGFGHAPRPAWMESVSDLAYLYLDLLEALDMPSIVMGAGFGGWIAAEMAVRSRSDIRALVLVDAVGIKVSPRDVPDILDFGAIEDDEGLAAAWHDKDVGRRLWLRPESPGLDYERVLGLCRSQESALRYGWKPFMHNPDLRRWLHRVRVPTLVVWGASDQVVRPDYGRSFAEAIPAAQFQVIEGAGHFPYLEQPQAFVEAVQTFVRSISGGAG